MKIVSPAFPTMPFAALLALTTTTAEMMLASGQVIGHRTERMLKPGPKTADDQREFELMGSEKIEAAVDSSSSMMSLWMTMLNDMAGQMMSAQQNVATAMSSLASSRTAGEAVERQMNLTNTVTGLSMSPARFAGDAMKLVGRGLAPFHSTALANAKRLGSI
jgi:hypothetical protein